MNPSVHSLWPGGLAAGADGELRANGSCVNVRTPTLTVFRPQGPVTGTGAVVCPGGSYETLSWETEGVAMARWLTALGMTAWVLRYRVPRAGHPAPLLDVTQAMRSAREQADSHGVRSDLIGIVGASAGGHLAACASCLFVETPDLPPPFGTVSTRPAFQILLYPVITMLDPHAHAASRRALLGDKASPTMLAKLSPERRVTARTPPAFLVHAVDDAVVKAEHSQLYQAALQQAGVPSELHLYPTGGHAFALRPGPTFDWTVRCERWLHRQGWLPSPPTRTPVPANP